MTDNKSDPVTLSVILVTHNSRAALQKSAGALLGELCALPADCLWEIALVDNASSDDSIAEITGRYQNAHVIRLKTNTGFAAACNRAASEVTGRFLLFLNPDVTLDPGAIEVLLREIRLRPRAGAVVGRMRNPDGSFQATCRHFPTRTNIFASRGSALAGVLARRRNPYTLTDSREVRVVPAAAATCMLALRDVFLELGGFDERFFMFMEDTDFCLRLHEKGYFVYFAPGAGGAHDWGKGSGGAGASAAERLRRHHQSVLRYFRKHDPGFWAWVILPILLSVNRALRMITLAVRAKGRP
ncbi:MAG: glycosyltransferase family 2 protein [Candidatus Zixiibacteriota bacterium]